MQHFWEFLWGMSSRLMARIDDVEKKFKDIGRQNSIQNSLQNPQT